MVPGVVGGAQKSTRSVLGADASLVRRLGDGSEGAAVTVNHFNDDVGCVVVYGTAKGRLHAVDLRAKREAFRLVVPPELGLLTATAMSFDGGDERSESSARPPADRRGERRPPRALFFF